MPSRWATSSVSTRLSSSWMATPMGEQRLFACQDSHPLLVQVLVTLSSAAEAIFKPNLLQTLGGGRRRRRRGLKEVLVRVSGENKSSSICIRMSLQPALVHAKGEKGWVEGAIIAADSQADIDKPQTAPGRAVAQVSLFPQCGLAGAWDQWGPSSPHSPRGDPALVQAPTQSWGTPTDSSNGT